MADAIAILGGSSAFTPALAEALADLAGALPLTIRLHGRTPRRVEAVRRFCDLIARERGAPHRYEATTSASEAVRRSRLVLNQVRVGGFQGRSADETFPLAFGLPGDETIGPGGLASAIRGVPTVVALAREAAAAAPAATFVNLTNPLGVVVGALARTVPLRVLGLCELPAVTLRKALALVGESAGDATFDYVGLNHQGWFTRIEARGRDLMPSILEAIRARPGAAFPVDPDAFGGVAALPLPYLRLLAHPAREAAAARVRSRTRGDELAEIAARLYDHYESALDGVLPEMLSARDMPWIRECVAPVIVAVLGGPPADVFVTERNGVTLGWLPEDAIVEKRCRIAGRTVTAIAPTRPPPARIADLIAELVRYERAAIDAALDPGIASIERALALHPLTAGDSRLSAIADAVATAAGLVGTRT